MAQNFPGFGLKDRDEFTGSCGTVVSGVFGVFMPGLRRARPARREQQFRFGRVRCTTVSVKVFLKESSRGYTTVFTVLQAEISSQFAAPLCQTTAPFDVRGSPEAGRFVSNPETLFLVP